jgi:hypothetical protein
MEDAALNAPPPAARPGRRPRRDGQPELRAQRAKRQCDVADRAPASTSPRGEGGDASQPDERDEAQREDADGDAGDQAPTAVAPASAQRQPLFIRSP